MIIAYKHLDTLLSCSILLIRVIQPVCTPNTNTVLSQMMVIALWQPLIFFQHFEGVAAVLKDEMWFLSVTCKPQFMGSVCIHKKIICSFQCMPEHAFLMVNLKYLLENLCSTLKLISMSNATYTDHTLIVILLVNSSLEFYL